MLSVDRCECVRVGGGVDRVFMRLTELEVHYQVGGVWLCVCGVVGGCLPLANVSFVCSVDLHWWPS